MRDVHTLVKSFPVDVFVGGEVHTVVGLPLCKSIPWSESALEVYVVAAQLLGSHTKLASQDCNVTQDEANTQFAHRHDDVYAMWEKLKAHTPHVFTDERRDQTSIADICIALRRVFSLENPLELKLVALSPVALQGE